MKPKFLAAKTAIATALMLGTVTLTTPAQAGLPVIDGTNLSQNIITAVESIAQTIKQIAEYQTQLQQYEDQLQNTLAPAAYIWDQAQKTISELMAAVDTLEHYKRQLGSIDGYLSKFQNVAYYRNSPCFAPTGCSDVEQAAVEETITLSSESQKQANDALFRSLEKQQRNLAADSRQLEQLQGAAQSATGRMQALGFANQLAGNQANQLLQIRALLIAQQNATATRMQAEADREARERAADELMLRGGWFKRSEKRSWDNAFSK